MSAAHDLMFLASGDGEPALMIATRLVEDGQSELQVLQALRRTFDQQAAAAALRQTQLRRRAAAKFGADAGKMWFLPESLEQASRPEVSTRRVARLVDAGVRRIVDVGAGVGGDSIAFARAGMQVTAIESDAVVAEALLLNARALRLDDRITVVQDEADHALARVAPDCVLFFDPARRADGRRLFDPEQCSPPLSFIRSFPNPVVAKMSPGLDPAMVPPGWESEWVSTFTETGRSVVEACLWSPPLAAAERRATVIGRDHVSTIHGEPDTDLPYGDLRRYVYEPDGAVNQAHLVGQVLASTDGVLLQPKIAYVTSDAYVEEVPASAYEVIEQMAWSKRRVKAALRAHQASDLIIKKRGISLDPAALRRELLPSIKDRRGGPLVLILCRRTTDTLAILARPAGLAETRTAEEERP